MRWQISEVDSLVTHVMDCGRAYPRWRIIADDVNIDQGLGYGFDNRRSASACRHKYYQLKRKQILDEISNLPLEERYRLLYKIQNMEGSR
jgi:hypothetical protein